jgi:hypothetical protein
MFIVSLLHASFAYAQQMGDPVLKSVVVEIWPEYDKPSALIIYHITLPDQVNLPATMSFRIPAVAGKPHAVAWVTPDKATLDMKYERRTVGEWIEIEFTTPSQEIQIEYYDPGLKKTGSQRDYTYRWPANYTVQALSLQVQKPVNATNLQFKPDLGSARPGSLGLEYYSYLAGKVNAGETFTLTMQYDKADDTLTDTRYQEVQPQEPLNSGAQGRVSLDQFLPWGVGSLGFLLIAVGILWYWKTGRISSTRTAAGRARHAHSRTAKPVTDTVSSGEATFCYQCGKKASPGDAFCRACGTKLR